LATDDNVNLRILHPSRKAVHAGDVFAMQVPDGRFLFGRVISTEAVWNNVGAGHPAILIYIYRHVSQDAAPVLPDRKVLSPGNLLVPPKFINRLPWSRGYFQTIASLPLAQGDVLPVHCFYSSVFRRYYGDGGRELPGRVEPCGTWALSSYRTVDDDVSRALGIPLAPD